MVDVKEKTLKKYECPWCSHKFEQYVDRKGEGHNAVTSQIKCSKCGNFLKTEY